MKRSSWTPRHDGKADIFSYFLQVHSLGILYGGISVCIVIVYPRNGTRERIYMSVLRQVRIGDNVG